MRTAPTIAEYILRTSRAAIDSAETSIRVELERADYELQSARQHIRDLETQLADAQARLAIALADRDAAKHPLIRTEPFRACSYSHGIGADK